MILYNHLTFVFERLTNKKGKFRLIQIKNLHLNNLKIKILYGNTS